MNQPLNTLVVHHQDGEALLHLKSGGFAITRSPWELWRRRITISISAECDWDDEDAYPAYGSICVDGAPLARDLRAGDLVEHSGGMDVNKVDSLTTAYGYFGFHVSRIRVRWTVLQVSGNFVRFQLEAFHDDVNYYDERAKPHPSNGIFELQRKSLGELWVPA